MGQNVTNVSGVSHEYVNSNFLQKAQAIDMSGQSIVNLGSLQGPKDAVRKKYVNEKFFKKGNLIDMNQKAIKNVLPPTEEGDAVTKGYVDSKSVGESDLDMNGDLVKNVRWPEEDYYLVNRAYVYFVAGKRLPIEGGTMQGQIDMDQHSIRNINSNPQNEDEVVPKQWIEDNFLNRYSPASTMARDLNMIPIISHTWDRQNKITTQRQKDTQIRSCRFWVEVCREGLGWLETGFHIWASLSRGMTQSD